MNRSEAASFARQELNKWNLSDWHVRLTASDGKFLGLCSYKDKCLILNTHHIDIHPEEEVKNTIRHEVAHALTPGASHNPIWAAKAKEVGCTSIASCSHLSLSPDIIDAIRSGADVSFEVETETIHKPKYTVTRLQDKCQICGLVAKERSSILIESKKEDEPDLKIITLECGHVEVKKIPKGTPFFKLVSNADDVKNCQHEFDKNQCIKCAQYRPFPFQLEGMKFIETALAVNKGVLLADEMGLGKTVQGLGYLKFHPEAFPVLFAVKSGIKFQFFKEIIRWLGIQYVPQVIERSSDILLPKIQVYIVSYDILTPKERQIRGKTVKQGFDIQKFLDRGIKTLVLDECQQIKNPDATRTQQIRRLAKHMNVIGMSGTPWKNRGSELFSILNMIAPAKFNSYEAFIKNWVDFYYHGKNLKQGGIRDIKRFREYTQDMLIRRERIQVMPELPLITRSRNYVELDDASQGMYDGTVSDFVKWYNEVLANEEENSFTTYTNILAKLQIMRHITGLAKVGNTLEFLDEFIEETDRKIVVFVHHKDVGQILYKQCKDKFGISTPERSAVPVFALSAELSSEERFSLQEQFNQSPRAILIASTLASGEGLNLQTCSDCIMHERQWNPANEEQAEGRFIRIGQQATTVTATYMTASDTVDDYLNNIVERKRVQFHAAMNRGEAPVWKETDVIKELVDTIMEQGQKKVSKIKKMVKF